MTRAQRGGGAASRTHSEASKPTGTLSALSSKAATREEKPAIRFDHGRRDAPWLHAPSRHLPPPVHARARKSSIFGHDTAFWPKSAPLRRRIGSSEIADLGFRHGRTCFCYKNGQSPCQNAVWWPKTRDFRARSTLKRHTPPSPHERSTQRARHQHARRRASLRPHDTQPPYPTARTFLPATSALPSHLVPLELAFESGLRNIIIGADGQTSASPCLPNARPSSLFRSPRIRDAA